MVSPLLEQLFPFLAFIVAIIVLFTLLWWFRVYRKRNQPKSLPSFNQDIAFKDVDFFTDSTSSSSTPTPQKNPSLRKDKLKAELDMIDQKLGIMEPTYIPVPRIIEELPLEHRKSVPVKSQTPRIITKSIRPSKDAQLAPTRPRIITKLNPSFSSRSSIELVSPKIENVVRRNDSVSITSKHLSTSPKIDPKEFDDLAQEINILRRKLR
ncbi:hypothetical protein HYV86_01345 [Candidatus Woesearchaeota archaeon]|nr:hypothetical protein [Candidatus Woesearchaeota archaeon]